MNSMIRLAWVLFAACAAGLSQEALAEQSGISLQAVSALERGQRQSPRRETVTALATVCSGCSASGTRNAPNSGSVIAVPAAAPSSRAGYGGASAWARPPRWRP